MKQITTLVEDINALLVKGYDVTDEEARALGEQFGKLIQDRLKTRPKVGALRMSNLGSPDRQLWYTVNRPERREDFDGATLFKFLFGDVVELLALFLAKSAGHTVELQQEEISLHGVPGHPDAVIDGVLVDVKSASGYGMQKFERHQLETDDPFHYLMQLSSYLEALQDHAAVKVKKEGAFLAVDKSSGKMVLDRYKKLPIDFKAVVEDKQEMLQQKIPPKRCHEPVLDGVSGNMKLPVPCSYCGFKKECHPGLRTFAYSSGPRYLTTVKKEPDVPEIK